MSVVLVDDKSHDNDLTDKENLSNDRHVCGLCREEFDNIEDFVVHKMEVEMLEFRLVSSNKIKNFLIPMFRNMKIKLPEQKIIQEGITDTDNIATNGNQSFDLSLSRITRTTSEISKNCGVCKKLTDKNIQQNFPKFHSKRKNRNCEICGVYLKSDNSLRIHQKIHSNFEEFSCKFKNCSYAFKTKGSLKRHLRRHTGERPYNCELCGRSFTESGALNRHKRSRIPCTNKSDADLPRYGKKIKDNKIGNLSWTIEKTNLGGNIVLPPKSLGTEYISIIENSFSNRVNSSRSLTSQICDVCNATFEHLQDFKTHLLQHNGKEYFKCGACNWTASEREFVIQHIQDIHSDFNSGIPHEIEITLAVKNSSNDGENLMLPKNVPDNLDHTEFACGKKCSSKDIVHKHLIHSEQRNYKCGECGKLYKKIKQAREHLRLIHSSDRPFSCFICKKSFKTMSVMKTHLKIHEDILPFVCEYCDKRFRQKGSLQRHQRIHSGEKPFVCKYCGRQFSEHGSLNRHLKAKLPCYAQHSRQLPNDTAYDFFSHSINTEMSQEKSNELATSCIILSSSELQTKISDNDSSWAEATRIE